RKLAKVDDVMRPLEGCRVARDNASVREIIVGISRPGRRTGAIMLIDDQRRLTGIFTDSDLARLLERNQDSAIDGPIGDVMTRSPKTVPAGALLSDAVAILANRKLSELPVIDEQGEPLGLIDITDVLSYLPQPGAAELANPEKSLAADEKNGVAAIVPFPKR